jgi:simple sugar transport system permease protein
MTTESAIRPAGSSQDAARPLRRVPVRAIAMPLVLLGVVAGFSVSADAFLTTANLLKIVTDASVTGILAFGMTFVLILAGIDLSVGSTVTLVTVVLAALLVEQQLPPGLVIVLVLLMAAAVGAVNGLAIVALSVPPLIVTLGMLTVLQGFASLISEGAITSVVRFDAVTWLGQGRIAGVPVPAVLLLLLAATCHVALTHTPFGGQVRAIGSNRAASRLMGLDVNGITVAVYALSGVMAGIAGLVVAGKLAAGSAEAGSELELAAIAAAVLGGTSLFGGSGSIAGTLVGALILSVVFNGLILLGVPFFYQLVITGIVLVGAVAVNELVSRDG